MYGSARFIWRKKDTSISLIGLPEAHNLVVRYLHGEILSNSITPEYVQVYRRW